jgi:dihydrofolate synthase/folylpolyglutamate synthase
MTTQNRTLAEWLAHCERLHARQIDLTLDRVAAVRDRLGLRFDVPVISVAGTNGKGSSCAMIESIARAAGWRVGLYSKPHLVDFEERCRIGGETIAPTRLLPHFAAVEVARGDTTLTYFEFTTLVIMRALAAEALDLVILEVGLGGRLDAVNVIDADVALITSIAIDHTDYLGPDRDSIGREKAGIARAGRPVIVADPQPPAGLIRALDGIGALIRQQGRDFGFSGDRQQWSWHGLTQRYNALAYPALRGANQLLNAAGALAALEALREVLPISAQAVRVGLATVELPGRFQIVPGEPTLVLDVAHNAQAVATLAINLDQMGFYPRTRAVFGAMRDKDIAAIVGRIAPLVDSWFLCNLPVARAATTAELATILVGTAVEGPSPISLSEHDSPREALLAALAASDPVDRIIVFGSFHTVGGVLKNGLPRRSAQHLN